MTQNQSAEYWEGYYKSGVAPETPSLFAKYVLDNYAESGDSLIELGCGNGRDARFFAANGVGVVAIDQCAEEIDILVGTNGQHPNLTFKTGDFTNLKDDGGKYDLIYSRFTLHSVTAEAQQRTLEWCKSNLAVGGKLCIETRGQKNEIYAKGEPVLGEKDAFVFEDHYRRFVDFDGFRDDIVNVGLSIIEAEESTGFAPFQDTDYHFIRAIAEN